MSMFRGEIPNETGNLALPMFPGEILRFARNDSRSPAFTLSITRDRLSPRTRIQAAESKYITKSGMGMRSASIWLRPNMLRRAGLVMRLEPATPRGFRSFPRP